jgi:protein-disulfide isomerase
MVVESIQLSHMKKKSEAADISPSVSPSTTPDEKQKGYWEFKVPRWSLKNTTSNAYLVFTLVIFSFFLGMLTNKVMFLEQAAKNPQANANTAVNATDNQQAIATPVPPPQVVKVDTGSLPIKGDPNAKVTIVEFSDFQCPFCKQYFDATDSQIQDNYVKTGKVKFAYRHFPLTTIHPNAQISAESAECANEQNKFWDYHDQLFQNQDTWSQQTGDDVVNSFVSYAGQLGMDTDQFKSCVTSHKYKGKVDADAAAGTAVQVDGTPAFFVNGYRITGAVPFADFKQAIDDALKKS